MLHIDNRGRVRVTINHVRYEINRNGVMRAYVRDVHGRDTERAVTGVPVPAFENSEKLAAAIYANGARAGQ